MLTFLKDLFRPSDRRQPQYDLNDARNPVNAGWRRVDVRAGGTRPIRFRYDEPRIQGQVPDRPLVTGCEFAGGLR